MSSAVVVVSNDDMNERSEEAKKEDDTERKEGGGSVSKNEGEFQPVVGHDLPVPVAKDLPVPLRAWLVLLISSIGVFMASVSTSALVIAFPVILIDLQMSISTMMWVLLVILLMIAAIVPIAGKLGDVFGQSLLYKVGYWLFVAGSFDGGMANKLHNGNDLVGARVIIGLGAALLFTNSSAILTNTFAPLNKVGLSQGIFQLSLAMGIVLGPLLGGGFAATNWRWIFFFNLPLGGLCAIAATFVVEDTVVPVKREWREHIRRFDWIGAIFCMLGLVLLLIAMIQGVAPDDNLVKPGPLASLVVCGCISGIIFIVDQFYAIDPLIPPSIFMNRVFSITTFSGTAMAFVRNSITYNMIFYLQGPFGQDPLQAGIMLIPFGIGIMSAGFIAGAVSDKLGVRNMIIMGPLCTLAACAAMSKMDRHTTQATVSGLLYLAGCGIGLFQSPNSMANMLSIEKTRRGVAAAIGMLTSMFCSMIGIVLTFSFVLNSMSTAQLFALFIYGGGSLSDATIKSCLDALAMDYYLVIIACALASGAACFIPGSWDPKTAVPPDAKTAEEVTAEEAAEKEELNKESLPSAVPLDEEQGNGEVGGGGGAYSSVALKDLEKGKQ